MNFDIKAPGVSEVQAKELAEKNTQNNVEEQKENLDKKSSLDLSKVNQVKTKIPEEAKIQDLPNKDLINTINNNDSKDIGKKQQEKMNNNEKTNVKKEDSKLISEEEKKKIEENEKKAEKIEELLQPEKIVNWSFDYYYQYYFHEEIGTISEFLKQILNAIKVDFEDEVECYFEEHPELDRKTKPVFDYEKYTQIVLDKVFEKFKNSYKEGINSFIFEKPPDNNLTTCFLFVLKAPDEFFEKYYIKSDPSDPNNEKAVLLLKSKSFQFRFNEIIDERRSELNELQKSNKEKFKKEFGKMKIGEIIDKEKEKLFNDLLKDYIKEKELTKLLNKFKPRILDFKLIISLDDISDNKQLEINKDNQVPIDEANIKKEKDKPISMDNVVIEMGNVKNDGKENQNISTKKDLNKMNSGLTIKENLRESKNLLLENKNPSEMQKLDQPENQAINVKDVPNELNINSDKASIKINKKKTIKLGEKKVDLDKTRKDTIKFVNHIEDIFQIEDLYLVTIIRNYMAIYIKKIADNFKTKSKKKFNQQSKKIKSLQKKMAKKDGLAGYFFILFQYYEIHFDDFLYLFLKILNFVSGLKIKLEVQSNKDIFIRIFYNEDDYDEPAEFLEYKMQLKPYSKVYERFFDSYHGIEIDDKKKDNMKTPEAIKSKESKVLLLPNEENSKENMIINDNILEKAEKKEEEKPLKIEEKINLVKQEDKNENLNNKNVQESNNLNLKNDNQIKILNEDNKNKDKEINNNKDKELGTNKIESNTNNLQNEKKDSQAAPQSNLQTEKKKNILLDLKQSKKLMKDFLKERFESDKVTIDDHHYFPPYVQMEYRNIDKFRKYLENDDVHECPKEEQYKLWVNMEDYQESSDEEEDENELEKKQEKTSEEKENEIYDVTKDIPCEKCYYYRNIDRLRIIYSAIYKVVDLDECKDDYFKDVLLINNYKAYEEKTTAQNLIFTKLNVYSDQSQGELIRLFRNFFGEKLAFYFLWYSFLLKYIFVLIVISSCVFILVCFKDYFILKSFLQNESLNAFDFINIIYSLIVGVWSTILIKSWNSKESLYAYIWGCDDFESDEPYSDNFKYDGMSTFIFKKKVPWQKPWRKRLKLIFSWFVIICLSVASIFIMYGIFQIKNLPSYNSLNNEKNSNTTDLQTNKTEINWYEFKTFNDINEKNSYMNQIKANIKISNSTINNTVLENLDKNKKTIGIFDNFLPILVGIIIGFQIEIMSYFNGKICKILTDWENHEKNSIHDDHYLIKLIFFEFVNNFSSMFYIAFIKKSSVGCNSDDCMTELQLHVYCVLGTRLIWRLIFVLLLYLKFKFKTIAYLFGKSNEDNIKFTNQSEHHQLNCSEYDYYLEDFNQTIIFFCFTIFFSASCPLTSLFIFVLAFINKNYDAFKIFNFYKLSNLDKSGGIGIYKEILKFLYYIGILINISIVIFANPHNSDMRLYLKFGIILGFVNIILILSYVINVDMHPKWFDNLYLFESEYRKKYFERPGPTYYHQDFIRDPTKKKKKNKNINKEKKDNADQQADLNMNHEEILEGSYSEESYYESEENDYDEGENLSNNQYSDSYDSYSYENNSENNQEIEEEYNENKSNEDHSQNKNMEISDVNIFENKLIYEDNPEQSNNNAKSNISPILENINLIEEHKIIENINDVSQEINFKK